MAPRRSCLQNHEYRILGLHVGQIRQSSSSSTADTSDCRRGSFVNTYQSYSVFSQESNPPQARRSEDFELVLQTICQKPRVVICDDGNTQFQDFARKLTTALALKVKMQNFAWFVFDGGLPEAQEVAHLVNLQQVSVVVSLSVLCGTAFLP